jgi:hypothetical protein
MERGLEDGERSGGWREVWRMERGLEDGDKPDLVVIIGFQDFLVHLGLRLCLACTPSLDFPY